MIHNYLLAKRSSEELELLRQDLNNTLEYYNSKCKVLSETINKLEYSPVVPSSFTYHSGCLCLLKQLLTQVKWSASKATEVLSVLKEQTRTIQEQDDESDSDLDDFLICDSDDEYCS